MILLILFPVLLFIYAVVGAQFSRKNYALHIANIKPGITVQERKVLVSKLSKLKAATAEMRGTDPYALASYHKGRCDKIRYNHIGTCDCGAVTENSKQIQEVLNSLEGTYPEPPVFKPIFTWPAYMVENYLKGGSIQPKASNYDPELTRRLESELGMLEVTK